MFNGAGLFLFFPWWFLRNSQNLKYHHHICISIESRQVEAVLVSVMSMLSAPNFESPANVDASVLVFYKFKVFKVWP